MATSHDFDDDDIVVPGNMHFKRAEYEAFLNGEKHFRHGFRDAEDGRMARQPDFVPYEAADQGEDGNTPPWTPENSGYYESEGDEEEAVLDDEAMEALVNIALIGIAALIVKLEELLSDPENQEKLKNFGNRVVDFWKTMPAKGAHAIGWVKGRINILKKQLPWQKKRIVVDAEEESQLASEVVISTITTDSQKPTQCIVQRPKATTGIQLTSSQYELLTQRFAKLFNDCDDDVRELLQLWYVLSHAQVSDDLKTIEQQYQSNKVGNSDVRRLIEMRERGTLPDFDDVLRRALNQKDSE